MIIIIIINIIIQGLRERTVCDFDHWAASRRGALWLHRGERTSHWGGGDDDDYDDDYDDDDNDDHDIDDQDDDDNNDDENDDVRNVHKNYFFIVLGLKYLLHFGAEIFVAGKFLHQADSTRGAAPP